MQLKSFDADKTLIQWFLDFANCSWESVSGNCNLLLSRVTAFAQRTCKICVNIESLKNNFQIHLFIMQLFTLTAGQI